MMTYLHALESSILPVGPWGLGVVWCVLYAIARFGASRSNALVASHPQSFISYGGPPVPIKEQSFRLMCIQIGLTVVIFFLASIIGGPVFVFLAGGWTVTTAVSIPLTLRRVLFHRALVSPGAASGSVTLSNQLAVEGVAFEILAIGAWVAILGIFLAHLALLGGGVFICATGLGYLRKVNATRRGSKNA